MRTKWGQSAPVVSCELWAMSTFGGGNFCFCSCCCCFVVVVVVVGVVGAVVAWGQMEEEKSHGSWKGSLETSLQVERPPPHWTPSAPHQDSPSQLQERAHCSKGAPSSLSTCSSPAKTLAKLQSRRRARPLAGRRVGPQARV